jgi:hypothetical protein
MVIGINTGDFSKVFIMGLIAMYEVAYIARNIPEKRLGLMAEAL